MKIIFIQTEQHIALICSLILHMFLGVLVLIDIDPIPTIAPKTMSVQLVNSHQHFAQSTTMPTSKASSPLYPLNQLPSEEARNPIIQPLETKPTNASTEAIEVHDPLFAAQQRAKQALAEAEAVSEDYYKNLVVEDFDFSQLETQNGKKITSANEQQLLKKQHVELDILTDAQHPLLQTAEIYVPKPHEQLKIIMFQTQIMEKINLSFDAKQLLTSAHSLDLLIDPKQSSIFITTTMSPEQSEKILIILGQVDLTPLLNIYSQAQNPFIVSIPLQDVSTQIPAL